MQTCIRFHHQVGEAVKGERGGHTETKFCFWSIPNPNRVLRRSFAKRLWIAGDLWPRLGSLAEAKMIAMLGLLPLFHKHGLEST